MRQRRNGERVRLCVLHSTKGVPGGKDRRPQVILPGFGPSVDAALRCARSWSKNGKPGGAHLVMDADGSVGCLADPERETAFHVGGASGVNGASIGLEIFQGSDAEIYQGQIDTTLATLLDIDRRIPPPYRGHPIEHLRLGARGWSGFLGHRDCDANRGAGDPGDAVMDALASAGWARDAG